MTTDAGPFNPRDHLSKLSRRQKMPDGQFRNVDLDYMEVKWRLVWLRSQHPDASIATEIVQVDDQHCIVKARVAIPSGGDATGIGSETPGDWKDYIEKAETKALGRALAALGFGTQFCEDFDFGQGDPEKVVDSPTPLRRPQQPAQQQPATTTARQAPATNGTRPPAPPAGNVLPATEPQVKAIYSIARNACAMNDGAIEDLCRQRFGSVPAELSRRQASDLIEALKLGNPS